MPLVSTESLQPDLMAAVGRNPLPGDTPIEGDGQVITKGKSALDVIGAAFETDNSVVSWLNYVGDVSRDTGGVQPGYTAWNDIKGTAYENYWESFAESSNPARTAAIKQQIDEEQENRRTLAGAGLGGFVASMGAGFIDPTILIPVGGQVKAAGNGVWSLSRTALSMGRAGLIGAAATEAILQGTQETRTAEESVLNIGGSAVLAGLLGTGVARLMNRAEQQAANRALENMAMSGGGTMARGDVGAAAVTGPSTADLTVAGGAANALADTTKAISPNMRANFRASARARRFSQELAENTLYQDMHAKGQTVGAAVETLARANVNARMLVAVRAHNDLFSGMRKAGIAMSRQEFEEAVGRAMRRGDQGENEFVTQAAQAWRNRVFEPFKEEAIANGLLPADVSTETAASYLSRLWNKERLTAQEPVFKDKVTAFYEGVIRQDYETQTANLAKRQQRLDDEIADLRLDPENRMRTLADLEGQAKKLDADNADAVERVNRVNELRRAQKAARDAGDGATVQRLADEIEKVQTEGGVALREYRAQRADLRRRRRNVDLNYAGMMERTDKIVQALVDVEESNLRSMQRLTDKGRKFERDLAKLDRGKISEKLSDLRTAFMSEAEKADKAVERASQALERDAAKAEADPTKAGDLDVAAKARIQREMDAARKRSERLSSIARRLEAVETLDPTLSQLELKRALDDFVMETSNLSLSRGERAERLKQRLEKLDPKLIDQRVRGLEETKARMRAEYDERWRTRMDAAGAGVNFKESARDAADQVFEKLTGRDAGNSASVMPEYLTPLSRGPLKDRTFNIPDELVEEFLESNVMTVAERYGRTMAAEVELTRRFGRADMRDQIIEIRQEYADLRNAVSTAPDAATAAAAIANRLGGKPPAKTKEALLKWLTADEKGAVTDLEAMRDLVRGTYKAAENATNYGRAVRSLMSFNYIRSMGGALVANLTEVYRPAMVHGLRAFMGQGIAPLLTNLDAVKLSVKEAQLAGQVTETVLQNRLMSLGEVGDPYRQGTAVERLLQNGARVGSKWNGLVYWTDAMKSISSVLSQNRILEGAVKGKDQRLLAYLGIDSDMAARVSRQFGEHGEVLDGVHVANTEAWADDDAVRAFRAAVSKDVDSIIVTRSVGDVPLFAHTPTGKMLLQFRGYALSSHQRVLLRGLQEDKKRFATAIVAMTTLGMMAAAARSWRGGRERWEKFKASATNPGYLIGEGLDATGIFALPIEAANTAEKLTRPMGFSFNPIKTPIMAAGKTLDPNASMQGESTRFAARDPLAAVLGPTAGLPMQLAQAAGGGVALARGEDVSPSQARAAAGVVPFGSYLGMREMLQAFTGDSTYLPEQ
jgi:hypothetical protein